MATKVPLPEANVVLSSTLASGLGANWRSTFDRYLKLTSSTTVIAERADGQQFTFTLNGSTWTPYTDIDVTLTHTGSQWTLTDNDDSIETYTTATLLPEISEVSLWAQLNSIHSRNGYTQTLNYSACQPISVTDSYNRALAFTYSNGLLQTVTTPDRLVISYGTGRRHSVVSSPLCRIPHPHRAVNRICMRSRVRPSHSPALLMRTAIAI